MKKINSIHDFYGRKIKIEATAEYEMLYNAYEKYCELEQALTQREAEVREEMVEKLKAMSVDVVAPDRKPPYRVDYVRLDKAINSLNQNK